MERDGGGWTEVFTLNSKGQSNGPTRNDMKESVRNFKYTNSSEMMIDLGNRWFIMDDLTRDEFEWMWDSGHGHEFKNVSNKIRTSTGKIYNGKEVVWQHWTTEIYQLSKNNGIWDKNTIFDVGNDSNHGAAFWDNADGIYKRLGGYQTNKDLIMKIKIR
jgi:hypothetical protein